MGMRETIFPACILIFAVCATFAWLYCSWYGKKSIWSIGVYTGTSPYEFYPHPLAQKNPVLTASDVTDVPALFVADPFMVHHNETWYMFFEVLNVLAGKGEIGLATSKDGVVWHYERIVLREPFHLSYPYVFEWNDSFYMVPESYAAQGVRLYRAVVFPDKWTFVTELMAGIFSDPSLLFKDGRWWLFVLKGWDSLALYHSHELRGPWSEHPESPLIMSNMHICRPGGRLVIHDDTVIRYTQDDEPSYGNGLRAFQIDDLTTESYSEHEICQSPILGASGAGWNAAGMHHIDPYQVKDNGWIACVDGKTDRIVFDGTLGMWRMLHKLRKLVKPFYL